MGIASGSYPPPPPLHAAAMMHAQYKKVKQSFLKNEGGCRDGVNHEKGLKKEGMIHNYTPIPTSFFGNSQALFIDPVIPLMTDSCFPTLSEIVRKERCTDGCIIVHAAKNQCFYTAEQPSYFVVLILHIVTSRKPRMSLIGRSVI